MPHQNNVSAIVFSPDGEYLATASADGTARTWDTTGGKAVVRKKLKRSVKALTPGGKYFATTRDDTAQVWKITSDMNLKKEGFPLEHNDVNSVAFSPKLDGKYVATVGANNDAKLWKIANSKLLELLPLHKEQERNISALAISPDRKYLVAVDLGKTARAWNTISSQPVSLLKENNREPKDFVETVTFSPDGKYLATASLDNTIQVWRIISGKKVKLNPQPKNVANAVAFSPDGKYLATVSDDNTVRIWEITSGKKVEFPLEHSDGVNAIAFSPDGKYLATASDDNTVRIWEITSGKKVAHLAHRNDVNAVAFSQDENYLVTVSDDNIVRVQPWHSQDLVDRACNYLTRNLTEKEWNQYLGNEPYRKTCPNLQSGATHPQSAFRAVRTWIYYTFL
jgi:WD40 repeat protein